MEINKNMICTEVDKRGIWQAHPSSSDAFQGQFLTRKVARNVLEKNNLLENKSLL